MGQSSAGVIAGQRIAGDNLQLAGNVTYNQSCAPIPACVNIFTQDVSHDAAFHPEPISKLSLSGTVQTLSRSHASRLLDTGRSKMQQKMINGTLTVPVVSDRLKRLRAKLKREALNYFGCEDNLTDQSISGKADGEIGGVPKPYEACLRKFDVYPPFRGGRLSKTSSRQLARFPIVEKQSDSSTTSSWRLWLPGHKFFNLCYILVGLAALSPTKNRPHEGSDSSTTSLWRLKRALCRESDSFDVQWHSRCCPWPGIRPRTTRIANGGIRAPPHLVLCLAGSSLSREPITDATRRHECVLIGSGF